jgi:hypothetical protein
MNAAIIQTEFLVLITFEMKEIQKENNVNVSYVIKLNLPAGGANRVDTSASLDCSRRATTVSFSGSLFLSNQPLMLYGTYI